MIARKLPALVLATLSSQAQAAITERGNIDRYIAIPSSVMSTVGTALPEGSAVGKSFLSQAYDPNLTLAESGNVSITFLHEGAGYKNSVGYFTFTTNGSSIEIVDRGLVFANASFADPKKGWGGGMLATGDTVTLRDINGSPRVFQPGDRIGLFLVANGWNGTGVSGWNEAKPALPFLEPALNRATATGLYTTIDAFNPEIAAGNREVSRHLAGLRVTGVPGFLSGDDFFVLGFEDQNRVTGSDNDFNDVVLLVTSNPPSALDATRMAQYSAGDLDGDGVAGLTDNFPNDPERAFLIRVPAVDYQTLAFEDGYPNVGDADFNDAVLQYAFDEITNSSGNLKELCGTFHLIARGANYDHEFGLALHGLPVDVAGSIVFERLGSDNQSSLEAPQSLASLVFDNGQGDISVRIRNLFPSTRQALPPIDGSHTNTTTLTPDLPPASVRFVLTFERSVSLAALGSAPFDPYLAVDHAGARFDVHLPGRPAFTSRPKGLPVESGSASFLDGNGFPWAILVPYDFRYPLEKVPINGPLATAAYPGFDAWKDSSGTQQITWYKSPNLNAREPRVVGSMATQLRSREWSLWVSP